MDEKIVLEKKIKWQKEHPEEALEMRRKKSKRNG